MEEGLGEAMGVGATDVEEGVGGVIGVGATYVGGGGVVEGVAEGVVEGVEGVEGVFEEVIEEMVEVLAGWIVAAVVIDKVDGGSGGMATVSAVWVRKM